MTLGAQPLGAAPLSGTFRGVALPAAGTPGPMPAMGVTLGFSCTGAELNLNNSEHHITLSFVCAADAVGSVVSTIPTGWESDESISNVWVPDTKL